MHADTLLPHQDPTSPSTTTPPCFSQGHTSLRRYKILTFQLSYFTSPHTFQYTIAPSTSLNLFLLRPSVTSGLSAITNFIGHLLQKHWTCLLPQHPLFPWLLSHHVMSSHFHPPTFQPHFQFSILTSLSSPIFKY